MTVDLPRDGRRRRAGWARPSSESLCGLWLVRCLDAIVCSRSCRRGVARVRGGTAWRFFGAGAPGPPGGVGYCSGGTLVSGDQATEEVPRDPDLPRDWM